MGIKSYTVLDDFVGGIPPGEIGRKKEFNVRNEVDKHANLNERTNEVGPVWAHIYPFEPNRRSRVRVV